MPLGRLVMLTVSCVAVLACAGCIEKGPFVCASNDRCFYNGAAGTCEPTGYCSFPDPTCDGNRYGPTAGRGLANTCLNAGVDASVTLDGATDAAPDAAMCMPDDCSACGNGSCNECCGDTGCQNSTCANNCACTFYCEVSMLGAFCAPTCQGGGTCDIRCVDSPQDSCTPDCSNGATCNIECPGGAQCQPRCTNFSTQCTIDCRTNTNLCSETQGPRCLTGAECTLLCTSPDPAICGFQRCAGGPGEVCCLDVNNNLAARLCNHTVCPSGSSLAACP